MGRKFSSLEQGIDAIAAGRAVIVVDSEDRENEGDFVAAAETISPRLIDFMVRQGGGQLCVPVMPAVASQLDLKLMVPDTVDSSPRFAIPIDHHSCGTGISALARAISIQFMLDPESRPEDFVRPGHIFPLIARPGGVLQRTGHTEAAVDLAALAGLAPAGVLCEVCSRDGLNMATRDELMDIAAEFDLPIITIDALVEYRRSQERSVAKTTAVRAPAAVV
jgi:3,4-dihydroxy 2-butanone 4-phosphate synthase / GTP cyclohydrolase II